MKRLMLMAALCVAPLGCVSNQGDGSIRFINAFSVTACAPDTSTFLSQGTLYWRGEGQDNYRLAMGVETNNTAQVIDVQGETLSSGVGLQDFNLEELIYSYVVINSEGEEDDEALEEETIAIHAVFRPGTTVDRSYLSMEAFGPKAVSALGELAGGLGPDESLTVLATIKARGHLGAGGFAVESNEFTFPITVYGPGQCSAVAGGACYPGQNATCTP
ncbi:hypothetical protein [Melittangium boletus]|uniref:Uncharacterized protein n=1 Tax=Melittangium boletus DSM 14713 TaxID=1294270 RepID=A0A250I9Z2_9BACT|nr:hypothetical protein [Melittangium boletus]ATB27981.1 hypothetical protein MEBOL_001426 [Melittangium boletus DSM 14713]